MGRSDYERFRSLTFDDFRRFATDPSLSIHEKIGFPDEYRQNRDAAILDDIVRKAPLLAESRRLVLDIGPGCGALAMRVIALCRDRQHTLMLADSPEMLQQLPDAPFLTKLPGYYPTDTDASLRPYDGRVDMVLAYSVLHYVHADGNLFPFVDRSLALQAPGGQLLLGDIPNASKRARFFASEAGIRFHRAFTGADGTPPVDDATARDGIDDAVVLAILERCRRAGFDAYVVPQPPDLPMANRREDIVVHRP